MLVRLQKFLADNGIASRRKAEQFILAGRVKVNDVIITELGTKVDPEKDTVKFNNKLVSEHKKKIVVILNKPIGYVCTARKFENEKSVLDLINIKDRIYPVGRLDKNSSGLLLLTNDGNLAQELTHPKYEKEKEYEVEIDGLVDDIFVSNLKKGVRLDEGQTLPAQVKKLHRNKFSIVLKEGKKRQIRRMCGHLGYRVVKLKRTRINNLKLTNLPEGQFRVLSEEELKKLA